MKVTMKYNMSRVFLQLKRQNKVLVLVHNTKATACVNLRAIHLIWDEFVLLNCHSFQLIGKITIHKKKNTSQSEFSFQLTRQSSYFI